LQLILGGLRQATLTDMEDDMTLLLVEGQGER
jgi:hypothetical protein